MPPAVSPHRGRTRLLRILIVLTLLFMAGVVLVARFWVKGPDMVCGNVCYTGTYSAGDVPDHYVALTFDDGPAGKATDDILAVLEEHNAPATFFMLGEKVMVNPDQVQNIYNAGHIIGNHTYSHALSVHDSEERILEELNRTNTMLESLTGHSAVLYRPPFLLSLKPFEVQPPPESTSLWSWIYKAGYVPVGVDLDSDDWIAESPEEALEEARMALAQKKERYFGIDQHIFLFHDDPNTAQALPEILTLIKEAGYEVVPLTTLLGLSRDVVMPPAETTLAVLATKVVLISSEIILLTIFILAAFTAAIAVLRIVGFLTFKYKQRTRAVFGAHLLPRFPGTITVLIPAYNEAENVRATIRSVLQNTRQPDEILVIDDGSSDNTLQHAHELEALYPERVRVLSKQNGGKSSALNAGVREATGDIIIAIDGDTVLHPSCLDEVSRPFMHERVGAVAGKILPARVSTLMEKYQHLEYIVGQNIDKELISSLGSVHIVPGAVGAWRKTALLEVGGYSHDTLVEDQDLTLALLGNNYGVVYVPSAVAYTEVPTTLRGFYLQRFRWTYGTFQCLYKYRRYLFADTALRLGWISLPYSFIFNILMPVMALALNVSVIFGAIVGVVHPGFLMLILFTLLDVLYAYIALLQESKGSRYYAFLVPLQRFAYLIAYSVIVFLVVIKVLDGSPTRWNKLTRNGSAERFFHEQLARPTQEVI